jgi:membrane protease YdiL (CAAX protease family)
MTTDYADSSDVPLVVPVEPRKRGWPLLAWSVIVFFVLASTLLRSSRGAGEAPDLEDTIGQRLFEIQAKYLVGLADWLAGLDGKLYDQVQPFKSGPLSQRLRFVILAGGLEGYAEALEQLHALDQQLADQQLEWPPPQEALRDILGRLYSDYLQERFTGPSLHEEERERLRTELGWFGELALAPAEGPDTAARRAVLGVAHRTVLTLVGFFTGFAFLGLAGFVELVGFLALLVNGRLHSGLAERIPHGGIYAETFALWMVVFTGLSILAGQLPVPEARFLPLAGGMLLSLSVLAWPVLRGVPWHQVRRDIGLTAGRRPALEPVIGLGGYAMTLPLLVVGVLVMLVLLSVQRGLAEDPLAPVSPPSHPATEWVAHSGWWGRLQILLLASVVAPLVEETMFRGVLYRQLREATAGWGNAWSVFLSGTVVSFLFAVIHPQGLIAVPALMALAYGFTLLREWRGTLVPAMVAHGINNAVVMLLLMVLLGV